VTVTAVTYLLLVFSPLSFFFSFFSFTSLAANAFDKTNNEIEPSRSFFSADSSPSPSPPLRPSPVVEAQRWEKNNKTNQLKMHQCLCVALYRSTRTSPGPRLKEWCGGLFFLLFFFFLLTFRKGERHDTYVTQWVRNLLREK
jgi:hypothetical protein